MCYQKASPNLLDKAGKGLGMIGHDRRKLNHQENGHLKGQKIENFRILKIFQIFMNFGWICKLTCKCIKMACKH